MEQTRFEDNRRRDAERNDLIRKVQEDRVRAKLRPPRQHQCVVGFGVVCLIECVRLLALC